MYLLSDSGRVLVDFGSERVVVGLLFLLAEIEDGVAIVDGATLEEDQGAFDEFCLIQFFVEIVHLEEKWLEYEQDVRW